MTTQQHALDGLRRAIVEGRLRPGHRVLQEEIAESLGVSVAPVREALRVLEQEGQVTYRPRRGYFVTELRDADALERLALAAKECVDAAEAGDVAAELEANRRFHFAMFEAPGQVHAMRLIRLLWDSTEAYRAMYYNAPEERRRAAAAHDRILGAVRRGDADGLVAELDAHRERALEVLRAILTPA